MLKIHMILLVKLTILYILYIYIYAIIKEENDRLKEDLQCLKYEVKKLKEAPSLSTILNDLDLPAAYEKDAN